MSRAVIPALPGVVEQPSKSWEGGSLALLVYSRRFGRLCGEYRRANGMRPFRPVPERLWEAQWLSYVAQDDLERQANRAG